MPLAPGPSTRTDSLGLTSATTRSTLEDEELRPYVIMSDIGKGSFATVYKGYHEDTHHSVAIKTVFHQEMDATLFENLQSEIQILNSLSHRHITKLLDIVCTDRNIYLIMEYCAGGDLANYIKKRGRVKSLEYVPSEGAAPQYYPHPRTGGLDEIVVRSFLRQLACALKFMQDSNLIHRDVKPQNLLLNTATPEELARGHPLGVPILKVADFGFARSLPNAMMAETLCGSPLYMAPEIFRYDKYDAKADLWSVGAVLYEMAVGKPPFCATNIVELFKKIEHSTGIEFPDEDPKSPPGRGGGGGGGSEELPVPPDVKKLIRALLKQNPAERASFDDFFSCTGLAKSMLLGTAGPSLSLLHSSAGGGEDEVQAPPAIPAHHMDPNAIIPSSKLNFRESWPENGSLTRDLIVPSSARSGISASVRLPTRNSASSRDKIPTPPEKVRRPSIPSNPSSLRIPRPLSIEGSFIPGETEEDGILRREYVLVGDTRAVEFTRAVDELTSAPRRPLHDRKIPPPNDFPGAEYPLPNNPSTSFVPPLSSFPSSIASRAASNALNRALSLASKKLFGAPTQRRASSSSARRPHIIALGNDGERDPLEDELLAALKDLAQKTFVLTQWADEMYEYVKAVPQKPLPDPTKFAKREGEANRHARRRKHADIEAESNAVTCVAVYMLLMSFSQKGIDKLRNHQEHMCMRHPDWDFVISKGLEDALSWFKEHFLKCNDRAVLVKTWLPAQYDCPKSWSSQLVYDRAFALSHTAARKELFDQATNPDEYGDPFTDEDRATIDTCVDQAHEAALLRCRAWMAMTDQHRLNDARADHNLAVVAHGTASSLWDVSEPDGAPSYSTVPAPAP
ncbi:kinase-like domain-containing protein [Mycena rosella]|uniref:non-specific serine/threonine protein kinase n=1 Tax=Mycena rosella TaxID=1033263 RepID=A0AAD7DUX7_MYCRO|nr:kinase-like domain-containing protein [Mycena rosella]